MITKQLLQILGPRIGAFGECTTIRKTTVGDDQVQVWIKLLEITKRVNSDGGTGDGFIERRYAAICANVEAYTSITSPYAFRVGRLWLTYQGRLFC